MVPLVVVFNRSLQGVAAPESNPATVVGYVPRSSASLMPDARLLHQLAYLDRHPRLMIHAAEEADGSVGERAPSAASLLSDALQRSAAGDKAAFAEVYDATSVRAFGLALRVLRDHAQAEEAVQEAYLQVWRQSTRFDPARGSAISWILMIVHGTAVSQVRSSQARSNREEVYERQVDPLRVGRDDPTGAAADANLNAGLVREALSQLTEIQRAAIEMAYFEGRTHTEVASLIGIPLGTAKTRIRDGLLRLRDVMATA